jgi:hypothetical protein
MAYNGPVHSRRAVIPWPALVFLAFFALLLVGVCYWYLLPALSASQAATQPARDRMAAEALLLLTILLIILLAGLLLTFKFHRFFFSSAKPPVQKTKYVDAWAEAGKRMEEPSGDEDE